MVLKQFFFMLGILTQVMALEINPDQDPLLVIGCRPWDSNVQSFNGAAKAHFIDFLKINEPQTLPNNFHHIDLNNIDTCQAGRFSSFARENRGKFLTIVIDWATYQHIRRDQVWREFAGLLKPQGHLIFPVMSQNIKTGESMSQEKAIAITQKLTSHFTSVDLISYDTMPYGKGFDFLRRPLESGRIESHLSMLPVIIVAKKT